MVMKSLSRRKFFEEKLSTRIKVNRMIEEQKKQCDWHQEVSRREFFANRNEVEIHHFSD